MTDKVLQWIDDICLEFPQLNKEITKQYILNPMSKIAFFEEDGIEKGVVCFVETISFLGKKEFLELFFYLKPQYRNLKTLNNLLKFFEDLAKDCDIIKIGANILFKDDKFIKFLERKGYKHDTLYKQLR